MKSCSNRWQFWIDRGGTFTDVVAQNPTGEIVIHKLLSENPIHYQDAVIAGIRAVMGVSPGHPIPASMIEVVKVGTTVATNCLLERKGRDVLLAVTRGFQDAFYIGDQSRPDIFARKIERPDRLYKEVVEIDERISAKGEVLTAINLKKAREDLNHFREKGFTSIAIVLMHGYRYQQHEILLSELATELGFEQISVSHQISNTIKFLPRGDTTVMDAYLSPGLLRYVKQIQKELPGVRLLFMESGGSLSAAEAFTGKSAVLSGPAGGVIGGVKTALANKCNKVINFDMGGTSTDVSHFSGEFERVTSTKIAGTQISLPMLEINTVAAGGGSILRFSSGRYQVGPESSGANPGPACYDRGGPLSLTDANCLLGRLQVDFLPRLFGPQGDGPVNKDIVQKKFHALAKKIGDKRSIEEVAAGFLQIAVSNVAAAIKKISVERGRDVREYTLQCFGGAGGQQVCDIADALEIKKILIHPYASVLSAYGVGLADQGTIERISINEDLKKTSNLENRFDILVERQIAKLKAQGITNKFKINKRLYLSYQGSESAIGVSFDSIEKMAMEFEHLHRQRFGIVMDGRRIEINSLEVEVNSLAAEPIIGKKKEKELEQYQCSIYLDSSWQKVPIYKRDTLPRGEIFKGPCLVADTHSTTVVGIGWESKVCPDGSILLTRFENDSAKLKITPERDPVALEIFNNLFMSIAEQMGAVLENTAYSVNIRERMDFSCAIFAANGDLIANAPHIPVHLASMSDSVKAIISENKVIEEGNVYMLNTPYNGGTHLPDITVVRPVFYEKKLIAFVAARGHHADIGGISPGSMPPHSTSIQEEGVLIDNFLLVKNKKLQEEDLLALLSEGQWPARNSTQNIADIKAKLGACERGALELDKTLQHYGKEVVLSYMGYVQDNAEEEVRKAIVQLKDGKFSTTMDNGAIVAVSIKVNKKESRALIDFSGTSKEIKGNFNAPSAICRAATLYVFRTLIERKIPINQGVLRPLDIIIPEGSLLAPKYPAAVVAGNVETSQVIVNVLYGAMGVMAASQGTMNNFTFGNDRYQYYETIAGGSGAGPNFPGASGVQTHMTNSRLTDPEVLEARFPVLLESFSLRTGSGGAGLYRGGDGVIRKIRFLEAMSGAILSGQRKEGAFGLEGGSAGLVGRNCLISQGKEKELEGTSEVELAAGDIFVIQTPGGGGFGVS